MCMSLNYSDLFFCCSLIEYIGRTCNLKRVDVINALGIDIVERIYNNADILHCEPIEKTADVYINMFNIGSGDFDNVKTCQYDVPDYWTIGEVYARLIENIGSDDIPKSVMEVYSSFISDSISNYNSDFFYQSREYIYECYKAGKII